MKKINLVALVLIISLGSTAQSFYEEETIQTIEIVFAESNWDALLDAQKAGAEDYIMAQSVTVNGEFFDSVGVKYKGNSTYNANQTKNPFHIELDTYKDQEYDGYSDIKLSNVAKDPSFIREVLSYKILRNYMDAPLSNYANVYVNGNLMGLYSNSESISKKFVNSRFGSKTNTFVKCNPVEGAGPTSTDLPRLVYLGADSTPYYPAYEMKSDHGWADLITFTDNLKNNVGSIEDYLDVDKALWMLAFNNTLVNLDSYIGGFAQNYYLYQDDYGRFIPVVWDLNESFGTFSMTGSGTLRDTKSKQEMSPLLNLTDTDYPLVSQLLSDDSYKKMYLAHMKTMLQDNFTNNGSYYTQGQALQSTIDAAVQADGNKFYTYANFTDNLTADITSGGGPRGQTTPGITSLMNGRYTYLMAQSEFAATEPTISAEKVSNSSPALNENLTFTVNVMNGTTVSMYYRQAVNAPFTKVTMFDDGTHGDGAAGDNVYGTDVQISTASIEYYFYAENASIGKFLPTNAAHEFFSLRVLAETVGDIVINEFMASNDATIADQDGDFDDWVELYNKGTESVDISGYTLSDDSEELDLFAFPSGTVMAAGDYLVVWADKETDQDGYHADFKISSGGETIYLANAGLSILDSVAFSEQAADVSYGRFPNGTGNFESMSPTFGAVNTETLGVTTLTRDDSGMRIYPNPVSSSFTIDLSQASEKSARVSIYNMQGAEMYAGEVNVSKEIETATWSPGVYFVRMNTTVSKLIVR
jgi:spore coat protein CotH